MPIFRLPDQHLFPPPEMAEEDGLLAVGGDLSIRRLIAAYANGIFPWYSKNDPILWWSPDPRLILLPEELKISKSLQQTIRSKKFEVKFDTCFEKVIKHCANVKRKDADGTWITKEMQKAYINLHKAGFAHSVETFHNDRLVGGLYGVSLGKIFFGESMFRLMTDASKMALYTLCQKLREWKFDLIDAQQTTTHLQSLGAKEVNREKFLDMLAKALEYELKSGKWTE